MSTQIQFADAEFPVDKVLFTKLVEMTKGAVSAAKGATAAFYVHVKVAVPGKDDKIYQQGFQTREDAQAEKDRVDALWA